jgi:serine/threonine protein kinase
MAPELVRKHEYDGRQVDMWALGVLLYALLTGAFPFRGQSEKELYTKIQRGQYKYPELMSRDARFVVTRLLEVDSKRRFRASELIREPWIKCADLPLSVFETAGGLFRANSVDGRAAINLNFGSSDANAGSSGGHHAPRSSSKAENFNRGIAKLHVKALDHLKSLGYSHKAIDDSLKVQGNPSGFSGMSQPNQVYRAYQDHIDTGLKDLLTGGREPA